MGGSAKISPSVVSFGGRDDGLSIQGASHIKHNKICQDYGGHYRCDEYAVAVVCDGHGGDAYIRSDRGSEFGVRITIEVIKEFMNNRKALLANLSLSDNKDVQNKYASKAINRLIQSIISRWNRLVSDDMLQNPFTEDELKDLSDKYKERYAGTDENSKFSAYGTTLMAVVYAPEFWFGIRNGDGKCVAVSKDGSIGDPIPWNDKCFLNRTTSMCDDKAFENFRQCFHTDNFPAAIYVATDGVDDSFGTEERLFSFYKRLTKTFFQAGFEGGKNELVAYLPKLTEEGSGDDISVSGIIDEDAIKLLFPEDTAEERVKSGETNQTTEEDTDDSAGNIEKDN